MINESKNKKVTESMNTGSGAFLLSLVATALFVCILVPVLISCSSNPSPKLKPYVGETYTPPTEVEDTEPEFVPVFAPSSVVIRPYTTQQTEKLAATDAKVDSQYAVLLDAETGEILAGKQSDVRFSPASMTKVMTLIVACENLSNEDLERKIPFSEEIHQYVTSGDYKGMELGLPVTSGGISCLGDTYYIKDMLYGIGVKSAAACSYMIVREICETEAEFVALMNEKARALGLENTVFDNVVGFDSPGNLTTAEDMAVIMAYAMQNDLIADILKPRTEKYEIKAHYIDENGEEQTYRVFFESSFVSREEKYPQFSLTTTKLTATKTGYTNESFLVCMATSKKTGKQYILVLGNKDATAHTTIAEKFKATMIDVEFLYNTYVE